jgi:excinuclease ABC subunit C
MRDAAGSILYIGKANDLAKRVAHYFNRGKPGVKNTLLTPLVRNIDYIVCASERESLLLERRLIHKHQPFFNVMWKDDKSYPYVKLTMGEDFPRILMTRRKVDDGGLYFGPYPKVAQIRGLLRYLWRQRFFALRPCRWDFGVEKPLDRKKVRACLYFHTGECPAPCAAKISREEYRKIAENAALFFRGRYASLRGRFEREMAQASSRMEYERSAQLRDNIAALSQMGEQVRVRSVTAAAAEGPIAASQAVGDLKTALNLPFPPVHIECFDISHFQGHETTASMVCFRGGEPHKEHYRRFKVRETTGIDDFKSMAEVVRRRYQRLLRENETLPDLVLIDGGKGQLGAAAAQLRKLGIKMPVVSLAKRIEEVFVPERSESLLLEPGRPALRLLQSLRDEAHRFALSYQRLLRGKKLFEPDDSD